MRYHTFLISDGAREAGGPIGNSMSWFVHVLYQSSCYFGVDRAGVGLKREKKAAQSGEEGAGIG